LDLILKYAIEADEQNDGAMYGEGEINITYRHKMTQKMN
jgi:hypothetical protein